MQSGLFCSQDRSPRGRVQGWFCVGSVDSSRERVGDNTAGAGTAAVLSFSTQKMWGACYLVRRATAVVKPRKERERVQQYLERMARSGEIDGPAVGCCIWVDAM